MYRLVHLVWIVFVDPETISTVHDTDFWSSSVSRAWKTNAWIHGRSNIPLRDFVRYVSPLLRARVSRENKSETRAKVKRSKISGKELVGDKKLPLQVSFHRFLSQWIFLRITQTSRGGKNNIYGRNFSFNYDENNVLVICHYVVYLFVNTVE